MALDTYANLQSSMASWLARDDLTTFIPDMITIFEAWANRRFRVRQQEASTTLTPASGSATLPTDYLQWRRVTWAGDSRVELEYVTPSYLQAAYSTTPDGTPKLFTIEGSTLRIRPTSTTSLEFLYYEKIDALSGTLNWLFTTHPDIYLFGSLAEAAAFNYDEAKVAFWLARRNAIADEIEALSIKTRGAGAVRPMGVTVV